MVADSRSDKSAEATSAKPVDARIEAAALYVVVFTCGAVLMSAEIVGSRILAPYFGSAIFVWGSLIGVVMVALAIGYYVGGRLADKYQSFPILCVIVAAAGLFFLVLPAFSNVLCGAIEVTFTGPRSGPLLASVVLFLVPGILLAMVSPFAVRLSAKDLSSLGNVTGRLYALSTGGSIVGTLGTAFFLVSYVGNRKLMFVLGLTLLLTAAAGLAVVWREKLRGAKFAAGIVLIGGIGGFAVAPSGPGAPLSYPFEIKRDMPHVLRDWKDSSYHLIMVTEQEGYKDPARPRGEENKTRIRRVLRFNDRVQSAIYIDKRTGDVATGNEVLDDYESAVGYTELLKLGLVFCPDAKKALVVGAGGAIAPTEFVRDYGMEVEAAEIDPEVERISRKWFHVDEKVKFLIGDGRRILKRSAGGYDIIILDAYSSGGHIPAHLTTKEFLELCRAKLSPRGVLVSNVISALEGKRSDFYQSEYVTMNAAGFANLYTFPRIPPDNEMRRREGAAEDYWRDLPINIIIIATQEKKRLLAGDIRDISRDLAERKVHPLRMRHREHYVSKYWEKSRDFDEMRRSMDRAILLTDNYCPVDTMFRER
jgi:spermidine synthase